MFSISETRQNIAENEKMSNLIFINRTEVCRENNTDRGRSTTIQQQLSMRFEVCYARTMCNITVCSVRPVKTVKVKHNIAHAQIIIGLLLVGNLHQFFDFFLKQFFFTFFRCRYGYSSPERTLRLPVWANARGRTGGGGFAVYLIKHVWARDSTHIILLLLSLLLLLLLLLLLYILLDDFRTGESESDQK